MHSLRSTKKKIRADLASPDWRSRIPALFSLPQQMVITALIASLADHNPELKWRAASALGMVLGKAVHERPESGRETMRRLIWALNEESGAVGWGMPEAMGEVMRNSRLLAIEFFNLLASYLLPGPNRLDFPPLRKGAAWGAARVAEKWPDMVLKRLPLACLSELAADSDPELRAAAARIVKALGCADQLPSLPELMHDNARVNFWNGRELKETTVRDLIK